MNLAEHAALRRVIEIDHHVAAEHDVERLAERPARVHQIERPKLDQLREFGLHAHEAAVRACAAQEVAALALGALAARIDRVDAAGSRREHLGVDVAGDDLHVGVRAGRFGHGHRESGRARVRNRGRRN